MNKREALAKEFNLDIEDILDKGDNIFSINEMEFLILTDEEADNLVHKKLEKTLIKEGIYALPWEFREFLKRVLDRDKLEEVELKFTKQGLSTMFEENFEEYKQMLINVELIDENDTHTKAELKHFINKLAKDIVDNNFETPIDTLEYELGEEDFWKLMIEEELINYSTTFEALKACTGFDRGEILSNFSGVEYPIEGTPYYYYRIK